MALYIHGPLRCKDLLGRIPNPHSRPALAAPQHAPGPRSDARSQRTPPGEIIHRLAAPHPAAAPATERPAPPAHLRSDRPAASRTHAAHTHTAQIRHPAAHAGSYAAPAAPHDQAPDSTKARTTIKPDRLFLLHDGTGHRPAETIGKNHTARPPPALPAASIFRRGDQPRIRQGENHQHDHSPAPNKSGPALEADHRPRREQQPPRPRSDRLRTSSQTGTCCTRPCDGKAPRRTLPNTQQAAPRPPANLAA